MRKVEYVCFANRSGYAQAAQDLMLSLHESRRFDVGMLCLHGKPDHLSVSQSRFETLIDLCNREFVPDADSFQVFHCIPEMQRRVHKFPKTVGFATFETFQPPPVWIPILNENDVVICPSKFNAKIFAHAGVKKPIVHIPHGIDTKLFNPSVEPLSSKDDHFTFLFFGTWRRRKGWPQLIEAWFREFDKDDKVRLVIKTDRRANAARDIEQMKAELGLYKKETAPIVFESRVLNELELPRFMKNADCLVSPTLGEGFGLPGLQSMALGVPVIITNFSGCQDYANDQTATLIEPVGYILHNDLDQIAQFENKKWAHVMVADVRRAMRHVLTRSDIVTEKAKRAAEIAARDYSCEAVIGKFEAMVNKYL
jgi:glycosyltransferase involved in cell wall biosynthesis